MTALELGLLRPDVFCGILLHLLPGYLPGLLLGRRMVEVERHGRLRLPDAEARAGVDSPERFYTGPTVRQVRGQAARLSLC